MEDKCVFKYIFAILVSSVFVSMEGRKKKTLNIYVPIILKEGIPI